MDTGAWWEERDRIFAALEEPGKHHHISHSTLQLPSSLHLSSTAHQYFHVWHRLPPHCHNPFWFKRSCRYLTWCIVHSGILGLQCTWTNSYGAGRSFHWSTATNTPVSTTSTRTCRNILNRQTTTPAEKRMRDRQGRTRDHLQGGMVRFDVHVNDF